MRVPLCRPALLLAAVLLATPARVYAQAGFDDDRVMIQGFYWESYRHGHPAKFDEKKYGKKKWYELVTENADALRDGRFDLIWLPPPSWAGAHSAGYNPKQYWKYDNSYGSHAQHRAMLEALLRKAVEPVADVVINHRDGDQDWADFKNPDWDTKAVCRGDEVFVRGPKKYLDTKPEDRGSDEERPKEYAQHGGTTYAYGDFRDLDHTNRQVRRDVLKYLTSLRSLGYRGWRYDMVHGYHAKWVALYNRRTTPTFSVGEYDWGRHGEQRGWVWHTATTPNDLRTASSVFDFTTHFSLRDNRGQYRNWYGFGAGLGHLGDTTDGVPWKNRAVTFLENHDTGFRTHEDETPQLHHENDSFLRGPQVEQGYAYLLTHPGVPCVYWKHYFDWGNDLKERVKALVNARKVAGVHAGSQLDLQNNAREKGVYAARVVGRHGYLYVRVGGTDAEWHPSHSDYHNFREYAAGDGWRVWVGLPNNPDVQQAGRRDPLPVPTFQPADQVKVPDEWLD